MVSLLNLRDLLGEFQVCASQSCHGLSGTIKLAFQEFFSFFKDLNAIIEKGESRVETDLISLAILDMVAVVVAVGCIAMHG